MEKLLQNKLVLTILSISLVLILGLVGLRIYLVYFYNPLEAEITDIEIKEMEIKSYHDRDYFKRSYQLGPEQADHIINNPQDYREVIYQCELKNNSTFAMIFRQKYDPVFPKKLEAKVVGSEYILLPVLEAWPDKKFENMILTDSVSIIVKQEDGDTDESLLELAEKGKLILTVGKSRNVRADYMGSYSIELEYEGE